MATKGVGLPSGHVTFMFSDIEGSTRLFRDLGDEYPTVLARHQAIVRSAITQHNGHEVKTEGDSFFVAFWSAVDALAACVEVQRDMLAENWPDNGDIRIRIGLHTGTAEPVGNDYVALAVHRAARVSAVAHGGQILLSAATVDALKGEVPLGCSLTALGRYRLKDFDEPEPLVQVDGPGLEARHPPLKALPAARHNMRVPATRFVGRRRERLKLIKLLSDQPVVTIVAQGGMGKSRLATEVALELADEMVDGSIFVELGGVPDDGLVAAAILEALGNRAAEGRGSLAALADAMNGRATVLVLDEAERVSAGVAAAVETIVAAASQSRILITSRQPLDIAGEQIVALDALSVPESDDDPLAAASDAVALLLDRLGVDDDVAPPDADELQIAAALCRRLDGLPLAIELAAARVPQLGLGSVLDGLGDGSDHESPVQDAIRWSYGLLGPGAQRLFRRLRWLTAPADADTIAAVVCGSDLGDLDGGDVADLLTVLAERSLVRPRRGNDALLRYRMLETVREVAESEIVAEGENAALDRSLVAWASDFTWRAHDARRESRHAAGDYSGDQLLLFLAAIDAGQRVHDAGAGVVLLEIAPTVASRGGWAVLASRAEELRAIPGLEPNTRVGLRVAQARAAFAGGDTAGGLALVTEIEALFPDLTDLQVALMEGELANDLLRIDPFRASKFAEHAVPILEAADVSAQVAALHAVGATRMMFGNVEGGRAAMLRCLALAERAGDGRSTANATAALGNAAFSLGDFDEAVRLLDDSVTQFRRLDTPTQLGPALGMAGHAHVMVGNHDKGIVMLQESLALRERFGDVVGALYCKLNLADSYDRAGRREEAHLGFVDAFTSCERVGVVPLQNAAAHGIAVTAPEHLSRAALVLLAAAIARSIGTSGVDEPITDAALVRLRASVDDAETVEAEGQALTDEEFLAHASAISALSSG